MSIEDSGVQGLEGGLQRRMLPLAQSVRYLLGLVRYFGRQVWVVHWRWGLAVLALGLLEAAAHAGVSLVVYKSLRMMEDGGRLEMPYLGTWTVPLAPDTFVWLGLLVLVLFACTAVLHFLSNRVTLGFSIAYLRQAIARIFSILARQQVNPVLAKELSEANVRDLVVLEARYAALTFQEFLRACLPVFSGAVALAILLAIEWRATLIALFVHLLALPFHADVARRGKQSTNDLIARATGYVEHVERERVRVQTGRTDLSTAASEADRISSGAEVVGYLDAYRRRRFVGVLGDFVTQLTFPPIAAAVFVLLGYKYSQGQISIAAVVTFLAMARTLQASFGQMQGAILTLIALQPLYQNFVRLVQLDEGAAGGGTPVAPCDGQGAGPSPSDPSEAIGRSLAVLSREATRISPQSREIVVMQRAPMTWASSANFLLSFAGIPNDAVAALVRRVRLVEVSGPPPRGTLRQALMIPGGMTAAAAADRFVPRGSLAHDLDHVRRADLDAPLSAAVWRSIPESVKVLYPLRAMLADRPLVLFVSGPWYHAIPADLRIWLRREMGDGVVVLVFNSMPHSINLPDASPVLMWSGHRYVDLGSSIEMESFRDKLGDYLNPSHAEDRHA